MKERTPGGQAAVPLASECAQVLVRGVVVVEALPQLTVTVSASPLGATEGVSVFQGRGETDACDRRLSGVGCYRDALELSGTKHKTVQRTIEA
jgi:hypothetical protein